MADYKISKKIEVNKWEEKISFCPSQLMVSNMSITHYILREEKKGAFTFLFEPKGG